MNETQRLQQQQNNAKAAQSIADAHAAGADSKQILVRDASAHPKTWAEVKLTNRMIAFWFPPIGPISAEVPVHGTPDQVFQMVFDALEQRRLAA